MQSYLTLSSHDEGLRQTNVCVVTAGVHGDGGGEGVGDGDHVGGALPHGCGQLHCPHDSRGRGLEGDSVIQILLCLLIAECHLKEGITVERLSPSQQSSMIIKHVCR